MKPEHYPDITRCGQLTKAGFPETEKYRVYNSVEDCWTIQTKGFLDGFIHKQFGTNTTDGKEYVCPSVSELLDVLKDFVNVGYPEQGWKETEIWKAYRMCKGTEMNLGAIVIQMGDVNFVADMILWLISQGYRFEDGKLIK